MQTIGERLEDARKKKGISIREAAEATKIRGDYLQKFESNHFDIGLTEIYTRGFLRNYSNFLKLPADRILADFAALGHGEVRPRQPSREIYGRMDISVATAGEASDRAAPPDDTPAEAAPSRAQPRYPRSGNPNLPTGPDPAVIFKYAKWGGGLVLLIVAVLVVRSLFSGGGSSNQAPAPSHSTSASSQAVAPAPVPAERTITLVALDVVRVSVKRKLPDESEGEDILPAITLARGQRQVVPWNGPIYISATAGQNLEIEFQGRRYPSGFTGASRAQMN
jgi:transcriptional regulator with XRE-family HTH domain